MVALNTKQAKSIVKDTCFFLITSAGKFENVGGEIIKGTFFFRIC